MTTGRCCCAEESFTVDSSGVAVSGAQFLWWTNTGGELDPLEGRLTLPPLFYWSDFERRGTGITLARPALLGGIPVRTYTSLVIRMVGYAAEDDGVTPDTVDYPTDVEIYCWSEGRNLGDFTSAIVPGIPRSELIGPVVWNASAESWIGAAVRTMPNIASIVNPVINSPGWNANSVLHLLFDLTAQQVGSGAFPPGRTLEDGSGANQFTMTW
jgi:hypothetical protein